MRCSSALAASLAAASLSAAPDVLEALDYCCAHDFSYTGSSTSAYAAGVLVGLVGRNEGGKTLSPAAVNGVLLLYERYFDPSSYKSVASSGAVLGVARRVATMAVSDANKKLMLQHDQLLDGLIGRHRARR